MSAPPLTTCNPDPHCRRVMTGDRIICFQPTDQQATAPAKSSLDRHSDRPIVPQTLPAKPQQSLRPRRPKATILTAFKSP